MPRRLSSWKACKNCKALVDIKTETCPICGSREFSTEWSGMIIVTDPEKSLVASKLGIEKPGRYALRVR
ncbi:MAG: DNA-binding protein [Thermoprotei archaeon]|nr:MAG: DNA-binding protein [Thermoprotei archaeon]RLF01057.1 MAG: DNA-binding protein [Thermoprotei archaeon]HDI74318.1 DNA-directed RNA polymerase, subunit E'' [Thermoprotei archaeon]